MARFVMASRRAGKFRKTEKQAARASMDLAFAKDLAGNVNVVGDTSPIDPEARRVVVFEADPGEIAAKAPQMPPDVLVEPEILHHPSGMHRFYSDWLPFASRTLNLNPGLGNSLDVTVQVDGLPVEGCRVVLYLRSSGGRAVEQVALSPASGRVDFTFGAVWTPTALLVLPAGRCWSAVIRGPRSSVTVDLIPLPAEGPLGWWHRSVGVQDYDQDRGKGIRVGVIDTGVKPHGHLQHVQDAGAFIGGVHDPTGGADVDSHGSHVCGTIGARPVASSREYAGIAPGVEVFSARVFPDGESGANQGDIANAIDYLSRERNVDLINLSLGASSSSEIQKDAIQDALERGTLCVCAAGNSNGPVEYPGALDEVIAVAALGLEGWGPEGSLTATRYPTQPDRYGNEALYVANFSCFGPAIDCCAPGVGIIATVPERFGMTVPSGGMDGTSMSSPAACGTLAALLATNPTYLALARDLTRSENARALLRRSCVDLGLASQFQGRGIVRMF